MTKPPFGFNPSNSDDEDNSPERRGQGQGFGFGLPGMPGMGGMPFGEIPTNPADLGQMLQNLQRAMSGQSAEPVNWDLAKRTAQTMAAKDEKPARTTSDQVAQAVQIADLWLNDKTALPSGVRTTQTWSRSEWVSQTLPVWTQLCNPVAAKMVAAMSSLIPTDGAAEFTEQAQMAGLPDLSALFGQGFQGILGQMGGMMFGAQVGHALAQLATEVLTSTDVGLPLGPDGTAVLILQNVEELSDGLDSSDDEIRLFLALREAAYHRLFQHVPWLKKKLLNTIEAYAAGIAINRDAIEQAVADLDIMDVQANPQKLQEVMSSGVFEPQQTDSQRQQLAALETLLALIEGWVDRVVATAAEGRLPDAVALAEMIRRRRATGGPAEQTFATLVGLQLRPRRLRDAARLWELIEQKRGVDGRDAVWEHPDLLPTSDNLDDPDSFATPSGEASFSDADLEALLSGIDPARSDESQNNDEGPDDDPDDSDGSGSTSSAP